MRHLMDRVSAGTWAAYAQARAIRTAKGDWPAASTLYRLAEAEGGDGWALLVLTRGELPARGTRPPGRRRERELPGNLERIFQRPGEVWTRPQVVVPTCEAMWACVLNADFLYAYLYDPWEREVKLYHLERAAGDWQGLLDRGPHTGCTLVQPHLRIRSPAPPLGIDSAVGAP
jgi:hypothetical protein